MNVRIVVLMVLSSFWLQLDSSIFNHKDVLDAQVSSFSYHYHGLTIMSSYH